MRNALTLVAAATAMLTLTACPIWGNCGDTHEPLVEGAYEFQYSNSYGDDLPFAAIGDGSLTVDLEAMVVTIEYTDAAGELTTRELPIDSIETY